MGHQQCVLFLPVLTPPGVGWTPTWTGSPQMRGVGVAETVKAEPDPGDAFLTSLSPLALPPSGDEGPGLLAATGLGFLTQPRPPLWHHLLPF